MQNHISFAVNILLNKNQEFESIVISAPENTPLEKVLKSKPFTSMIKPSIEETLWSVQDLPEEYLADKIDEIWNTRENLKQKQKEIKKPDVPVMAMNTRQIEKYLPALIDSIYENHKIKAENKRKQIWQWICEAPDSCISRVKKWNNRSKYNVGPRKGIRKRSQLAAEVANVQHLENNPVDPNIYAKNIPEKYAANNYSDEDLTLNARTGKGKLPKYKKN